jgi:hypothetical protein
MLTVNHACVKCRKYHIYSRCVVDKGV